MVSALCWACLVRPWASHPLECGLSSAPGVLVFKPLAFFPSWVLTIKSKAEALDTSDSSDFPTERKHFKAARHCLKCLVEMLRNLAGTLRREDLQTIPRHQPCPAALHIPGGGADSERRTPAAQEGVPGHLTCHPLSLVLTVWY